MDCLKTIIFIGTNKSGSSREALKAAEHLGYFTVLFTNNEKQLEQREAYGDVHEMILVNTESLIEMKREINKLITLGKQIKSIVSFIDSNVYTASVLSNEFCHNKTSSKALKIMENKAATTEFLQKQPYIPTFHVIRPGEPPSSKELFRKFKLPVIVKSATSTGSKDVFFAKRNRHLRKHVAKLQKKNPEDAVIIEEFVKGDQYLVEAIVYNGDIQIAGIIKQEVTFGKRFIITGYGVLAQVPAEIKKGIEKVLTSIIHQFKIHNGSLHLEMRLSTSGWKLIEINPRISGGAMNKMLKAAFGFNLVEETLKINLGEQPSVQPTHKKFVFTQYVIVSEKGILEKVTGKGRAKNSPGILEVYVKPRKGTRLTPPLSMGHRYAYVIATADSIEEAERLAKNAANEIEFHLMPDE